MLYLRNGAGYARRSEVGRNFRRPNSLFGRKAGVQPLAHTGLQRSRFILLGMHWPVSVPVLFTVSGKFLVFQSESLSRMVSLNGKVFRLMLCELFGEPAHYVARRFSQRPGRFAIVCPFGAIWLKLVPFNIDPFSSFSAWTQLSMKS